MADESIHDQVAAALVSALGGITAGADYHYTPDAAYRVVFFEEDFFDESLTELVLLRPETETHREETSQTMRATAPFEVLVARRHGGPLDPVHEETPTRYKVADRLARDVVRKLLEDVTLGGLVENVATSGFEVDRARYLAGWALVSVSFTASYTYERSTP